MNKIHNIFSKSVVPKEELTITVDYREKNSLIPSFLIKNKFQLDWRQLPVADYIINGTAIERKTIQDLKSSIINRRIFDQLKELKQYPSHLLFVEGILDEDIYNSTVHENALRGFLLSVALEFQTPIIFTHNEQDTAKYIYVLAKKEKVSNFPLRPSKILLSREEQLQFILEGFPNIGPAKSKKLLEKFHTLNNIFHAREEELNPILGIKTKEFRSLLN